MLNFSWIWLHWTRCCFFLGEPAPNQCVSVMYALRKYMASKFWGPDEEIWRCSVSHFPQHWSKYRNSCNPGTLPVMNELVCPNRFPLYNAQFYFCPFPSPVYSLWKQTSFDSRKSFPLWGSVHHCCVPCEWSRSHVLTTASKTYAWVRSCWYSHDCFYVSRNSMFL